MYQNYKNTVLAIVFETIVLSALLVSIVASQPMSIYDDIRFTLPPKSDFEPAALSVEDTRYIGISYITEADSVLMRNCAIILRQDLDYSPLFRVIYLDTVLMKHMELTEMSVLGWKWLGTKYLVKPEAEFLGENIRLSYRLLDVTTSMEIKRNRFEAKKSDYRALAHTVANDIVKALSGEEGIYRSKVVYVKKVGEAKELFIADYDGYNERQLTKTKSINLSPTFSPDGEHIYFTSYMDDRPKLYMLTLRNNNIDLLAGYPGMNAAPAVSPDGQYIACALSKDGNSEIYLLDRSGKVVRQLTKSWAIETAPTWSPDGRELAFTSDRTGTPQIYVIDREGLNERRLTFIGRYNDSPCWSPKGDRIVFVSREGNFAICSIDITGKDFRILSHLGDNENPHYSPDGNHIIFASTRLGQKEIYTMDLFGQDQRRLTTGGGYSGPNWGPRAK